jgi:flagellar hook assembly protein FlgD
MLRLKFKILNNRQTRVPLEFSGNKTAGDIEGRDMVVKVTSGEVSTNGVIIPVTPPVVLPDVIDLKHNYPNPFSTSTIIGIDIPSGGSDVILDVYDTLGRYVTTVFKGRLIAGTHEFNFDGRNLTSGLYIYRLRTSEKVLTKKMILIK